MKIRTTKPSDYDYLISVVDEWWGGRDMAKILPRQFLNHFYNTSFIVEADDLIVGFLIGYQAPAVPDIGYVHFIGVHPRYRRRGIASFLYTTFASCMKKCGAKVLKGITGDTNKLSQAVHTKLGFTFEAGDAEFDGIPIHQHYDGNDSRRVVFHKFIDQFESV